jgi:hypothetical protein
LEQDFLMIWLALLHIFSTVLELVHIGRLSEKDKDLEIMILRHQLDVMTRLQTKPVKPNRVEKLTLAVRTKNLKQSTKRSTHRLRDIIRIVKLFVGTASWSVANGLKNRRIKVAVQGSAKISKA